ncbi:hypothetical protein WEU38_18260 (plasmid) [Cyanobacterium aponinum AL20118]|uniref:Uncharacterized protein n=1 Tax=Cyanobacterium aponinum AL20115 TaxID=3090662 RepID=A0AAF0ZEQ0_9CHRO|nr:hypothetical protein [Cyanobacterium aponinum]WPF90513.1 hypothetical protein SAY89_18340 [Cyanobacterium aponinum AL20115]
MVSLNSISNLKRGEQPKNWINTPTKAIRIPIIFEDKILSYAHQLDEGLPITDNQDNRNVQKLLTTLLTRIKNEESGYKGVNKRVIKDLETIVNEVK